MQVEAFRCRAQGARGPFIEGDMLNTEQTHARNATAPRRERPLRVLAESVTEIDPAFRGQLRNYSGQGL